MGAVLLVALITLATCVFRGSQGNSAPATHTATKTPPPSPSAVASPSSSPSALPSLSATPSVPPVSPSVPPTQIAAPAACTAAVVQVSAGLEAVKWTVGSSPRLKLTVVNHGTVACQGDLGASQREYRVMGGRNWVWSSDDCSPAKGTQPSLLQPGKAYTYTLTWSGLTSNRSCAGQRTRVGPGTYQLVTRWAAILSQPVAFTVVPKAS